MKLIEYYKYIRELLDKYGEDLNVMYSTDIEGNSFEDVYYVPSVGFLNHEDGVFYPFDDIEDDEDFEINAICVN